MRWSREVLRTCIAGLVMHYTIVVACSDAGGGGGVPLRPLSGGGGSSGAGARSNTAGAAASTDAPPVVDASVAAPPDRKPPPSMGLPIAEASAAEDGSRLKARWYAAQDGARQWAFNWFDVERNEECTFQRAADGVLRCMPTPGVVAITRYLDASCTEPVLAVAVATCSGEAPRYIVQSEVVGCESRVRLTVPGVLVAPETLYNLTTSDCVETQPSESYTYRRPGAEVPPTSFVSAEVTREP